MSRLDDNNKICSVCNYDNAFIEKRDNRSLFPNTLLNNKYHIGRVISANGEGFIYIALDLLENKRVWIKEFFPDTIAFRDENSLNVFVNENDSFQFKALLVDFSDLQHNLLNLRNKNGIVPVVDFFEENGTAYGVLEYVEGIPLEDFLTQIGGFLSYEEAETIFEPFFNTVQFLHMNNIIHRGISTETVLIDKSGNLKLTGFAISEARTTNSDITPEFFEGYSAPEQYSTTEWHGTWTDVYSLACTFYRVVTGVTPIRSIDRATNDTVLSMAKIDSTISKEASYAIHQAMIVNSEHRTESMDSLINSLFYENEKNQANSTRVVDLKDEPGARVKSSYEQPKRRATKKSPVPYTIASTLITVVVLLFAMGLFISALEKNETVKDISPNNNVSEISGDSSDELSLEEMYILPNFANSYLERVELDKGYNKFFIVQVTTEYDELKPKDTVISQDRLAGTQIKKSEAPLTIQLVVSKGPQELPDMKNMKQENGEKILREKDLMFQVQFAYDEEVEKGNIIRLERGGNIIMLYISKGMEETDESTSDSSTGSGAGSVNEDDFEYYFDENGFLQKKKKGE